MLSSEIFIFIKEHQMLRKFLYDKSSSRNTHVCDLSRKSIMRGAVKNCQLQIICVSSKGDLFRMLVFAKTQTWQNRRLFIIAEELRLSHWIEERLGAGIIRCKRDEIPLAITILLDTINQKGVLQLNSSDILNLFTQDENELSMECVSGKKELVLYSIFSFWNSNRLKNCMLLHIMGNITLQDVCDVYAIINRCDPNFRFSCTYDEKEQLSVFSLWRIKK